MPLAVVCPNDSIDEAQNWGRASVDMVIIDGSQVEDHMLDNLRAWVPKVRKGGVLLMHDVHLFKRVRTPMDVACEVISRVDAMAAYLVRG